MEIDKRLLDVIIALGERMGQIPFYGARQNEVDILNNKCMALSYLGTGRPMDAYECIQKAVAIGDEHLSPNSEICMQSHEVRLRIECALFGNLGNLGGNVKRERKCLEMVEKRCEKGGYSVLVRQYALACALDEAGELSEAIELLDETSVTASRMLGPDHAETKNTGRD